MSITPSELDAIPCYRTGAVVVDADAIAANFRVFSQQLRPTTVVPVLKANAYGLGMLAVFRVLYNQGVRSVFLATLEEGIELRQAFADVAIYILHGLLPNTESLFAQYQLTPVLNTYHQMLRWQGFATQQNSHLPAIIHLDTGMSRTGMSQEDAAAVGRDRERWSRLRLHYVMSHLSCSEQPEHPLNAVQLQKFNQFCRFFPGAARSLSASTIVHLPSTYQFEMARIGYGIYGYAELDPTLDLKQALSVYGRVVQVRQAEAGDNVGYGGGYQVAEPARLATIGVGYADGFHRFLDRYDTYVNFGPFAAKLVGRISMDFCVADVSHIPKELVFEGAWAELIGPNRRVEALIQNTQFIPHEIPIALGRRYHRIITHTQPKLEPASPVTADCSLR